MRSGVPLDDTKDDTAGEFTRWIFFHELLPPLLLLLRLDFAGFDVNEGEVVGDMGGEGEGVSELHPVGLPSILCGERNDPLIMCCLLCVVLCCVCMCCVCLCACERFILFLLTLKNGFFLFLFPKKEKDSFLRS